MNDNKKDVVKVPSKPATNIIKFTPISYYIIFLTIYILAFVCIFEKNVQLIGYGLLYTINILASIFLVKDLHSKIANNVPIFVLSLIHISEPTRPY